MTAVLPINRIMSINRSLFTAVTSVDSPFSLTSQVQDWGGERWDYKIDFATMGPDDGRVLSVFFAALGGQRTPFLLEDPTISNPGGLGVPLVNGGGQTGNSLVTDGWSAVGLRAGDFFSLGADDTTRLYQVTADVTPTGGAATIQFVPRLRASPANNAPLNVTAPRVLLRLDGPAPAGIALPGHYRFSISAREDI